MADHTNNASPRFTISAAVVKQLGEELVSDEVTAIMELVKNSYDAKATYVIVEINNKEKFQSAFEVIPQSTTGYVIITDNGIGMSSNDVYSKWLTISMSEKRQDKLNNKFSEKDRTPLGEKGVGRLSTQRIGDIVDLITGVKTEKVNSHISFKWSDFNESTTLDKVKITASNYTKSSDEQGTKIIVRDLRDLEVWQGDAFNRILGELSQLILPGSTKGFKVYLKQNDNPINIEDITTKIQQNAICSYSFNYNQNSGLQISGKIKLLKLRGNKASDYEIYSKIIEPDNGKSFFDFLTNKTLNSKEFIDRGEYVGQEGFLFKFERNIDNTSLDLITVPVKDKELVAIGNLEENKNPFNRNILSENSIKRIEADPGPFKGQIYEFSFVSSPLQNTFDSFASFKQIVQNQAGVRIYRDGFGIKPYGLEGNDWLKLSARATSGGSIYGLRPQNVIGYIEISARDNNNLKEKTDREGFMESPYSNNFFQITSKVRDEIDLVLEKTRRSYNEFRKYVAVENVGINDAKSTFQNLKKTAKDSQRILKSSTGLEIKLYQLKDDLAEIETNLHGDKSNRLVKELLPKIEAQIQEAADLVIELKKLVESTARLDDYIDYLQPQIQSLETQLKDFTELAALGLTAEALSHELANIVDRLNRLTTKASKFKHTNREYPSEMSLFINDVKNIVGSFRKQLSHLDPALNYVRESKDEFSLKAFIKETIDFYEEKYDNKIYLTATLSSNDFKLRVNKGRMVQILDNLILNSGYWLTRKKEINPSFDPTINFEINYPFLRISDNGLGIDKSIENTLFQPFVTTKPTKSGRGLGLFIVQQLLDSISCTISLLPNRNSSGNRYIFQLNLASLIIEE